ncbi:nucleotide-diphospho-sugar transferase [Aspergillus karnatakaensis]|uniref:nucleotide-diphospho-sugar transferase n=1 Tax=Aspergillus karnatakaensis TaxID=1810916 RepID=UPI003CCD09CE
MARPSSPQPKKVWASLITNLAYLPGLLTLHHSLQQVETAYPFVALYTSTFPESGLAALAARGIRTHAVPSITPSKLSRKYEQDPRFRETWTKLVVFSLEGVFERIVLLDGDMLVRRNMDELMEVPLDGDADEEEDDDEEHSRKGKRVFAASHACACNPFKKAHYPAHWIPKNCAFTTQHTTPTLAQTTGASLTSGVGMLNSGLLVVNPSATSYALIRDLLDTPEKVDSYTFPDQELLSEAFKGRWVPLPYVYNALKTMRAEGVHSAIWRDEEVKNVHYIFAVKPWQEEPPVEGPGMDVLNRWWWEVNWERQRLEQERGIQDGH